MEEVSLFKIVKSFNANRILSKTGRLLSKNSICRSSLIKRPNAIKRIASEILFFSIVAKKPILPKLIPTSGTPLSLVYKIAFNMVPSPPRAIK